MERQRSGFNVSQRQAQGIKKFNEDLVYVQGIKAAITGGGSTASITINLNSSGRKLLGISVTPTDGLLPTLADSQLTFTVNNNNLLLNVFANNLNPNFVQNMVFFPTPQPLVGTDSISMNFTKNNAGDTSIIINVFYVPQKGV